MLPTLVTRHASLWMVVVATALLAGALTIALHAIGPRHVDRDEHSATHDGRPDGRLAASDVADALGELPCAPNRHSDDCHCIGLHDVGLPGTAPPSALVAAMTSQASQRESGVQGPTTSLTRIASQPRAPPNLS